MSDRDPAADPSGSADDVDSRVLGRALLAAVTLLTILPVPAGAQARIGAREVAASAPFFPLVGLALGFAVGALAGLIGHGSGGVLAAGIAVTLVAILTGALHLDGLADGADALGARGGSRERRLEIMRDSATGAYGTAAIAAWFVLTAAAVASIPPAALAVTLGLALMWSRVAAVAHARLLAPARPGGLGAGFAVGGPALAAAVLIAALLTVGAALLPTASYVEPGLGGPGAAAIAWLVAGALIAAGTVGLLARRLLGGRTGDTLGATIAVTEAIALMAVAIAST